MIEENTSHDPVILIAEDEELLRLLAAEMLEDHGYRVLEADDAESALKILAEQPDVCLLFTDIEMPGRLNGIDLAQQVHARWPKVMLIVTSGRRAPAPHTLPEDGRFLAKPYRADELLGEIGELLQPPEP
jgi:CheY-like chemotaxis protein